MQPLNTHPTSCSENLREFFKDEMPAKKANFELQLSEQTRIVLKPKLERTSETNVLCHKNEMDFFFFSTGNNCKIIHGQLKEE